MTLAVYLLEYGGWLASPEGILLSAFLGVDRPFYSPKPTRITTLAIDDDAYKNCFGYSPMNPSGIRELVQEVLTAKPDAVGVDIITDSENDEDKAGYAELERSFRGKPVVWAAAAVTSSQIGSFVAWARGGRPITVQPTKVLGMDKPGDLLMLKWGLPIYPREEDLRLRRFPRTATVMDSGQARLSWAGQVAETYCHVPLPFVAPGELKPDCSRSPKRDEVLISFAGPVSMPSFKMLELFDCNHLGPREWKVTRRRSDRWDDLNELAKGSIVLIGGTFASARDSYPTPIGPLDGLHFNAYAVQAELSGTGVSEWPPWVRFLLDIAVGLVIASVFETELIKSHRLNARIRGCLGVLGGTLALSLLVLYPFGYVWLSCVGIAVGMTLHVFIEIWKERLVLPVHENHSGGAPGKSAHGGA